MDRSKINQLIYSQNEELSKLKQIVIDAIREEELLSEKLQEETKEKLTTGEKFADKVSKFGGSWFFILSFFMFLLAWIAINLYLLSKPYDPYPFILLNLILSCIAAIQAPIIMMSQNRKEDKDRQRAQHDYLINLKAEIEIRNLHQKIDLLIAEQMKRLFDVQTVQLEILEEINTKLDKKQNS
jgi:uncharacterized membrane protein